MKSILDVVDQLVVLVNTERHHDRTLKVDARTPQIARMRDMDVSHLLLGDEWLVLMDASPDVLWPIRCGYCMQSTDGVWNFVNVRSVTAKEVRGRANRVSSHMLQFDTVMMSENGVVRAAQEVCARLGGKWVDADHKKTIRHHDSVRNTFSEDPNFWNMKCELAIGIALRHRYEWSVSIGLPSGPSFRFATDAVGVRSMLKERDAGDTGRRAALRGWVVDHWRQSRADQEAEVYVRKHLRGGESFVWRGYQCQWSPSQYDVERNKALADERAQMGRQATRKSPVDRGN